MTISEFLAKTPLNPTIDLIGRWKQRGTNEKKNDFGEKAIKSLFWMRTRIKRAIKKNQMIGITKNSICKFKRGKVPFAKIGETMYIYDDKNNLIYTCMSGGGRFILKSMTDKNKSKSIDENKDEVVEDIILNTASARKRQNEIPYEERTGWTNFDLVDQINMECVERGLKYWANKTKKGKNNSSKS